MPEDFMAHYGTLGEHRFSESDTSHDIRGATVYGSDNQKLGEVDDVIFDHNTMEVAYVVVTSGGLLQSGKFIVPVERMAPDEEHERAFCAELTPQQAEDLPLYKEESTSPKASSQLREDWKRYEQEYKKFWHAVPVLHRRGTDRTVTPLDSELEEEPGSTEARATPEKAAEEPHRAARRYSAAELFPERIADKFGDPAPSGGKITLRPKAAAQAEDAAQGTTLLKPHWWENLSHVLRRNRSELQASCPHCEAEKRRDIA
jgi:hypothetical protein